MNKDISFLSECDCQEVEEELGDPGLSCGAVTDKMYEVRLDARE